MLSFFDTVAGDRFVRGTVPELVKQIKRLANAIEHSNELKEKELELLENREEEQ